MGFGVASLRLAAGDADRPIDTFIAGVSASTMACRPSSSPHTKIVTPSQVKYLGNRSSTREIKMPDHLKYRITCHCGHASQTISGLPPDPGLASGTGPPPLNLCHCRPCRKNTGLLCVSYMRIKAPPRAKGLVAYRATEHFERFFCGICGCHVFWRGGEPGEDPVWAVATGVIQGSAELREDADGDGGPSGGYGGLSEPQYVRHINVASTRDGGLSIYLPEIRGRRMDDMSRWGEPGDHAVPEQGTGEEDILPASCHCGNVSFHITRPDESSSVPSRFHADLVHPYCSTPSAIVANSEDEKWWLRLPPPESRTRVSPQAQDEHEPKPTRFLAGTCSCQPCRLISGFEIQSWAFVSRSNIFFHVPSTSKPVGDSPVSVPLDFSTLPPGVLKSYHSSPGVAREFCARCGATVFWREDEGAEILDISAGLFDAKEGARAESWLEWWTGRVSFAEETGKGRGGETAARAESLIASLEEGMKATAR